MAVSIPDFQTTPTEQRDQEPSVPLYVAGTLVILSGLYAVNLEVDDSGFAMLTYALAIIGAVISFLSRKQGVPGRTLETPAVIATLLLCVVFVIGNRIPDFLAPTQALGDRNKSLAILLVWIALFHSFMLVNNSHLLFACVPTIALMGLIGTSNANFELIAAFVTFLSAAAFMLVHENALRAQTISANKAKKPTTALQFGGQVQMTLFCVLGALLAANLLAVPLHTVGQYLIPIAIYGPNTQKPQSSQGKSLNFQEQQEVRVATGPVSLSAQVVMRVKAATGQYWRGTTFDYYTGKGWRNTRDMLTSLDPVQNNNTGFEDLSSGGSASNRLLFRVPVSSYNPVGEKTTELRQTITLEPGALFREVYAAAEPKSVSVRQLASVDGVGSIHVNSPMASEQYEVVSRVPDTSPETLRSASGDAPPNIRELYLQLPDDSESLTRIRESALEVTRGLKSNEEKVEALKAWIGTQCKYNTDAPAAPSDQDVVFAFLFTLKEGYCDSFATALAVMCRTIGIPARVASGFLPGELQPEGQQYAVREMDKHQWTEVFYPGIGWVKKDATEGTDIVNTTAQGTSAQQKRTLWEQIFRHGVLPPLAFLGFLCLIAYLIKVEVFDRRKLEAAQRLTSGIAPTNGEIVAVYQKATSELGRIGAPRQEAQTPDEYLTSLRKSLAEQPAALSAMETLTLLTVRFRYSRDVATDTDVKQAQHAAETLRNALRQMPRRRAPVLTPVTENA